MGRLTARVLQILFERAEKKRGKITFSLSFHRQPCNDQYWRSSFSIYVKSGTRETRKSGKENFPGGRLWGRFARATSSRGDTGSFATGALIRAMDAMGAPSCLEGAKPTFPRFASSIFVLHGCSALRPFRPSHRPTRRARPEPPREEGFPSI